jgi:hypothetical protein
LIEEISHGVSRADRTAAARNVSLAASLRQSEALARSVRRVVARWSAGVFLSDANAGKVAPMEPAFARYAESLHPTFERLVTMPPVTIATLPRDAPKECVYLFSEKEKNLYVGRTRHLRQRMRQHSIPSSRHNQAVFAFRLAREATGRLVATYTGEGTRALLAVNDPAFTAAFTDAKKRVRAMQLRYVEETNPLREALLEIYASIVLATPYNDFNTH